jgi:hypothetical protein
MDDAPFPLGDDNRHVCPLYSAHVLATPDTSLLHSNRAFRLLMAQIVISCMPCCMSGQLKVCSLPRRSNVCSPLAMGLGSRILGSLWPSQPACPRRRFGMDCWLGGLGL